MGATLRVIVRVIVRTGVAAPVHEHDDERGDTS
jgi:hypothetical protein